MSTFSERYGYVVKPLQLESMTIELRNRIWNIYRCEICNDIAVIDSHYLEEIMDACGLSYTSVYDNADLDKNLAVFRKWYDQAEWYRIYDFVEIYLAFLPTKDLSDAIDNFNGVLSAENAGYRVIGRQVVPITNEYEIKCIEQAQQTPYNSINVHLKKATELFSRRPLPDYENSIKESISAVEAVCSIITGLSGKNATLGKTIKMLFDYLRALSPRNSMPINLILEEAHRFVRSDMDYGVLGYNIFERIAKEGRKFGLLMGISSQRPSELSKTVVSQCNNFIIHKIQNPDDIQYISRMVPYMNQGMVDRITYLRRGYALVFGTAINLPTLTAFEKASPSPNSGNSNIVEKWYVD